MKKIKHFKAISFHLAQANKQRTRPEVNVTTIILLWQNERT